MQHYQHLFHKPVGEIFSPPPPPTTLRRWQYNAGESLSHPQFMLVQPEQYAEYIDWITEFQHEIAPVMPD